MKSVFEDYKQLWPKEKHKDLEPLLSKVPVLHWPEQASLLSKVLPNHVVIVVDEPSLIEVIKLVDLGFEHVVQKQREDFPEELLASSLMVLRPEAFMNNPVPFFFTGFQPPQSVPEGERNLVVKFNRSQEKSVMLDWLSLFLDENPKTVSIKDICMQTADELISNALFNAPVRFSGSRPYKDLPRDSEVEFPEQKRATLFASFSDRRVVIGCTDVYGSLAKEILIEHLRVIFKDSSSPTKGGKGGAGLGFKYLIENAANIYVMSTRKVSTLVACGFLLKGLKSNLSAAKHFHLSFR